MRIIYSGPAASGKTTKLISHYLQYQDDWQQKGYYLVPNNQQINELENQILKQLPSKVLFAPTIETINSLAEKIFPVKKNSEVRKQLLLLEIIKKNNYFQEVSDYLSVYETISDIVSEIRNYSIDLLTLRQDPSNTIAKIIEQYEKQLVEQQLYDMERILASAANVTMKPLRYLILDGFDSFNKLHEKFLESLFACSQDIYIGLTYDQNNPNLFKDSLQLREFLLARGFEERYSDTVYLPTPIKEISQNFLSFGQGKKMLAKNVGQLTGDNLQLQYELIAKQILEFYKTGEYQWSDFGIILRQINERRYLIKNCFEKFNIPVTVNEGLYLWRAPLLQWLMKLYFFALSGLLKEELLSFLNSAFVNLKYRDFNYLKRVFADYPFSNTYQDIEQYIDNRNIKDVVEQLQLTCEQLRNAKTFRQQWQVINQYCLKNKVLRNLKNDLYDVRLQDYARENIKAYSRLKNYFEDLHEELTTTVTDLQESFTYIEHFLTQTIIKIDCQPADRVQVYDAPQARQKRFKVVFLADLVLGNFPLPQINRSLLDDTQRQQVGLRSYLERQEKENLIFYQLISCADQFIFFCDYVYSLHGSKVTPSIYLDWLNKNYTLQNKKNKKVSEIFFQLNDLSGQDYRYALVNYFYANYPDYDQQMENEDLQNMDDNDLQLIKMLITKKNDLKQQRLLNDYCYQILKNKNQEISVTALEKFARCPFLFFCKYILGINSEQEFSIYAFRGSLIHKVLELFFKRSDFADLSVEQMIPILAELLDQQLELLKQKYPQQYFTSEKQHLLEKLLFFLQNHITQINSNDVKPVQLEYKLTNGSYSYQGITINGKIDRIDEDFQQYQVVDYKTGQIRINKEKLDQILLYTYILNELDYAKKSPLDPYYLKFPECTVKKMEFDKAGVEKQLTEVIEKLKKADFYHFDPICEYDNYQHCEYRQICSKIERETSDD